MGITLAWCASGKKEPIAMPEWVPINWALMKHPLNWFIVFFMVVLPLVAVSAIHDARIAQGNQ